MCLIWDHFEVHTSEEINELFSNENRYLKEYVPEGCTSLLHPLDV